MKTILAALLAGTFLVSLPLKAEEPAPAAGKAEKGKGKEKKAKGEDSKKDDKKADKGW